MEIESDLVPGCENSEYIILGIDVAVLRCLHRAGVEQLAGLRAPIVVDAGKWHW